MIAAAFLPLSGGPSEARAASVLVYVGTVTQGESEGIYLYELDSSSGKLTARGLAAEAENPSFVALHPDRPFLYAVDQMTSPEGRKTGAVSSFAIDEHTGKLTLLNQRSSRGSGPCHVSIDGIGRTVMVANYGSGSVSAYPVEQDGRLGEAFAVMRHDGSGPNERRQKGPHAHSVNFDPASRFAFAADLGTDEVVVYRLDSAKGALERNDPPAAKVAPGSGPRHFAFHPGGEHAYVINELTNTIVTFSYDAAAGVLREVQTVGTLPEEFAGESWTAEVLVHPSGKYVYGSNRGHDSIVVFAVAGDGTLTLVEHQPTQGKHPRNFGIDPSGRLLIVANRDSDNLVPFWIDPDSGKLTPVGETYSVGMPVCVRFR